MFIFVKHLQKKRFYCADLFFLIFLSATVYTLYKLSHDINTSYIITDELSLAPKMLPYYTARSLLRMFIALFISLIFTFIYGYVAAKIKSTRKLLLPLLDVLQSIPILGFLSITITLFINIFPNSLIGLECASIFSIFTSQAWNMTFSFYHSLLSIPEELTETADVFHLNHWQRFINIDFPVSAISLIWNSMMSFSGSWFFLTASEAISVLGNDIHLPGIGSYLAAAASCGDIRAMIYALIDMLLTIIVVDQLFWRPLLIWGQRFKMESTAPDNFSQPNSFVYSFLCQCSITRQILKKCLSAINNLISRFFTVTEEFISRYLEKYLLYISFVCKTAILVILLYYLYTPAKDILSSFFSVSIENLTRVFLLGLYTCLRVLAALLLGALWTVPIGVKIGFSTRLAAKLQPFLQIVSSFPANMLFPFFTLLFLQYKLNLDYMSILLMMLGTQWYILFNVIAGASSISNDLREVAAVYQLSNSEKWRKLILPSIFPHLVTGLITACGGAWNASIVAELVTWKDSTLIAHGIGAYISIATTNGNWSEIIAGLIIMCAFVILINYFVWQKLYNLIQTKYHLD